MATGAFTSCVIDHTGRGATLVFGAPAAGDWDAPLDEASTPPAFTVNGLAIPSLSVSTAIDTTLTIVVQLQGVVHLNDVVTLAGDAGWYVDVGEDATGAMSDEEITNNSKQLQDEV